MLFLNCEYLEYDPRTPCCKGKIDYHYETYQPSTGCHHHSVPFTHSFIHTVYLQNSNCYQAHALANKKTIQ